jgi:hypothetical protein
VIDSDVNKKGNYSLIKIKPECREKYGGHEQVAASLRRLSSSPAKRESYLKDMFDQLYKEKRVKEVMIANASEEVLDYIKKNSKRVN